MTNRIASQPIFLALALAMAMTITASAQTQTFTKTYDATLFSASYSSEGGDVHPSTKDLDSKVGVLAQNTYIQEFNGHHGAMMVQYIDLPTNSTFSLDGGIDGMLSKLTNVTENEPRSNTNIGKLPARGAAAKGLFGTSNAVAYLRVAIDAHRTWAVLFLCLNDVPCPEADANAFFNNVKIK
jgi:hypothetical protein